MPVVRDDHQRLRVVLQEVLQPDDRADVQMVRRLVQQQQIGGREQRGRQRHSVSHRRRQRLPHSPASAQQMRRRSDHFGGEAEAFQNLASHHVCVDQVPVSDLLVDHLETLQLRLRGTCM